MKVLIVDSTLGKIGNYSTALFTGLSVFVYLLMHGKRFYMSETVFQRWDVPPEHYVYFYILILVLIIVAILSNRIKYKRGAFEIQQNIITHYNMKNVLIKEFQIKDINNVDIVYNESFLKQLHGFQYNVFFSFEYLDKLYKFEIHFSDIESYKEFYDWFQELKVKTNASDSKTSQTRYASL